MNLAPRFRAIDPPDRPGLNLRLVVRLNHPICDQNEPKNVHYLPVVAPRMILQDAPNNDFQVLGPFVRSRLRAPTAPPRCGRGANRQLVIWGYAGICGLWLLSTRGTLYDPLPAPRPPLFGGLRFPSRWKGVKNCSHAPGGPSRLLNYPHHAKIKPGY